MPYVADEASNHNPPPLHESYRHQRWLVWACAALFYGYQFALRVSISVMTNDLMSDFAIDAATVGSVSSFYYVSYATLQIPVGIAMDTHGPRKLLLAASLFATAGALVFGTASSIISLCVARMLIGCGASCGFLSCVKLASLWFPAEKMPMVIGITTAVGTIGATSAGGPLAACIGRFGWRTTIRTLGFVGFGIAVLAFLLVRDGFGGAGGNAQRRTALSSDADDSRKSLLHDEHRDSSPSDAAGAGTGSSRSPLKSPLVHSAATNNGVAVTVYEAAALTPAGVGVIGLSPAQALKSIELQSLSANTASALTLDSAGSTAGSGGGSSPPTPTTTLHHSNGHSNGHGSSSIGSTNGSGGVGSDMSGGAHSPIALLQSIFSNRQTWIFGAFGLLAYPPISVLADMWATRYVSHVWMMDTSASAFTVSFLYIGVGCGAPVWAYLSSHSLFSHRKPIILGVSGALFWTCCILYGPYVQFHRLVVLFFGIGFCISAQSLAFSAVVALNTRSATGTATAIQNMGCMISGMIFQPITGLLLDYKHAQIMHAMGGDAALLHTQVQDYHPGMTIAHHTAHFTFALSVVPVCLVSALIFLQFARETFPRPTAATLKL